MFGFFKKHPGPIPAAQLKYMVAEFELSDHAFRIAVPEAADFDAPGAVYIEQTDLTAAGTFNATQHRVLLDLLCDFPKAGRGRRSHGSMRITLRLHKPAQDAASDLLIREQLLRALQSELKKNYQAINDRVRSEGIAAGKSAQDRHDELIDFRADTDEAFHDKQYRHQRWVTHRVSGAKNHGVYSIALDPQHYLSVDFEHQHAQGSPLDELLLHSQPYEEAIMKTCRVVYAEAKKTSIPDEE